jgi:hypothetical protein
MLQELFEGWTRAPHKTSLRRYMEC